MIGREGRIEGGKGRRDWDGRDRRRREEGRGRRGREE